MDIGIDYGYTVWYNAQSWATKQKLAHAGGIMFNLKQHNTTVRTELIAGITTFMAMAYILMVNAGMFSALGDGYYNAVYIATAISAVFGTLLIGLLANLPLAPGFRHGP